MQVLSPRAAAGDAIPAACRRPIEVRIAELRQLFNAIDPSPFLERDLDPKAEEFIVDWSRDLPAGAVLALVVHLERAAGPPEEASALRDAVHEFFRQRALHVRRRLRDLFWRGRVSLVIALAFLATATALGNLLSASLPGSHLAEVLREGLLIGGWVAMWRPLEVFLYDWWPLRADVRLFDRLGAMPVRIEYHATSMDDAWRWDWPTVSAGTVPAVRPVARASEPEVADQDSTA